MPHSGPMKLYGCGASALILKGVATVAGTPLETLPFTPGCTNETPWFLALSPTGSYPVVVTPGGESLLDLASAARHLATHPGCRNPDLFPHGMGDRINVWLTWAAQLVAATPSWMSHVDPKYASVGGCAAEELDLAAFDSHLALLERALESLPGSHFIVMDFLTLADVAVAFALLPHVVLTMDPARCAALPRVVVLCNAVYGAASAALKGAKVVPASKVYSKQEAAAALEPIASVLSQPWSGVRTRAAFNEFFQSKGHTYWPSSAVVPLNDPTLLFTNAEGAVHVDGTICSIRGSLTSQRFSDVQRCLRAGGKHNDLDAVGYTARHHTFFEMLGNWSFGDYFKRDAIHYAWELLTVVFKLPADKLWVTVYHTDEEAFDIWNKEMKVPAERIVRIGDNKGGPFASDNFWQMADTGPCGPCTEIFFDVQQDTNCDWACIFDRNAQRRFARIGGRDAAEFVNYDDPNVLEIWNNVFIQFNREADGSLRPLPAQHVDTGMGLERVTSIMQNQMSNYATDLFSPIFDAIKAATGARPYTDKVGKDDTDTVDMAYRVVADHIRTLCFSIADGARPGNEGRDYVLRRILRRAVRYGREVLGGQEGFFATLVDVVVREFGGFFPELIRQRDVIFATIREEEASFSRTLVKGIERFKKAAAASSDGTLPGSEVFVLWDTFGFPMDLTQLMAEERGLTVDKAAFETAMEEAREKSRARGRKSAAAGLKFEAEATGWLQAHHVPLTVGDLGSLVGPNGSLTITDAQLAAGYVLHVGELEGSFAVGDEITCKVDYGRRAQIAPNHTFTHVLNYALRTVLGDHVDQRGSIVQPDKLRFDFSNNGALDVTQLLAVEAIVHKALAAALPVHSKEVPLAQAKTILGLRAVFGEVYPDPVRVVVVGKSVDELLAHPTLESNRELSIEFCGGTHLSNTAQACAFALISEEGVAKGTRLDPFGNNDKTSTDQLSDGKQLSNVSRLSLFRRAMLETGDRCNLGPTPFLAVDDAVIPLTSKAALRDTLAALGRRLADAAKAAAAANKALATATAAEAAVKALAAGSRFLVMRLDVGLDAKAVGEAAAAILAKSGDTMPALLVSVDAEKSKVLAYAAVPDALLSKIKANEWVNSALTVLGGKGGGKPSSAQGQGGEIARVDEAMEAAIAFARQLNL
ncbi:MAG: hypothetical protein WDW38_011561 [Sanguina aurantia]